MILLSAYEGRSGRKLQSNSLRSDASAYSARAEQIWFGALGSRHDARPEPVSQILLVDDSTGDIHHGLNRIHGIDIETEPVIIQEQASGHTSSAFVAVQETMNFWRFQTRKRLQTGLDREFRRIRGVADGTVRIIT